MPERLSAVLPMLPVLRLGQTSEKDLLERLEKDGARIDRIELEGEKDALTVRFTIRHTAALTGLRNLRRLRYLSLSGPKMTDASMRTVGALTGLKSLILSQTAVTDAGLKELKSLRNLVYLSLTGTPVTDAGLEELPALANLCVLNLENCSSVTDAGLGSLTRLKCLEWLDLRGTGVTEEGAGRLQKALPGCTVCYRGWY